MNTIFGPDGIFTKAGDCTFAPNGTYTKMGSAKCGPTGMITEYEGMAFLSDGGLVTSGPSGVYYGPKGMYTLQNGTLHGPGGRMWTGVSEDDVTMIIDGDR